MLGAAPSGAQGHQVRGRPPPPHSGFAPSLVLGQSVEITVLKSVVMKHFNCTIEKKKLAGMFLLLINFILLCLNTFSLFGQITDSDCPFK